MGDVVGYSRLLAGTAFPGTREGQRTTLPRLIAGRVTKMGVLALARGNNGWKSLVYIR